MQVTWVSAHLFYTGDLRSLLLELVRPFIRNNGYKAFFIRYWEDGPHIRLRIQVPVPVVPVVQSLLLEAAKPFTGLTVRFIEYVPEITRYGNEASIGWAEEQFICSSHYVLDVLHTVPAWSTSDALLHALKMNITLLYAMEGNPAQQMETCDLFIRSWLPRLFDRRKPAAEQQHYYMTLLETRFNSYAVLLLPAITALWDELAAGTVAASLQRYKAHSSAVFRAYDTLGFDSQRMMGIAGSFMHMGHNRLGVSNLDEAYIMFFTLQCLQHVYAREGFTG